MILIVLLTMDGDVTSESLITVKTLTKWLSFCILRTSSPELKKAFREAERLQEKIIKLKTHLKFNKTCLIYYYICIFKYIYIYKLVVSVPVYSTCVQGWYAGSIDVNTASIFHLCSSHLQFSTPLPPPTIHLLRKLH